MSKPWYYEMMGSELGPFTGAQLIDKAKKGHIQPDTRVRSGKDGKWQFAERVKGLFPPPVVETPTAEPVTASASPASRTTIPLANDTDDDRTYHFQGESTQSAAPESPTSESTVFEFFEFIGFRQAISSQLYEVLLAYSKTHGLNVTQITRRALAEFLKRPDLAEERPSGETSSQPASSTEMESGEK